MTRSCSGCTLCCRLVPVRDLDKPAGVRCKHQSFKGCAIYKNRPTCCVLWNCRWLTGDDTADLRRPDRCHYVIDIMPDFVTLTSDGAPVNIEIVQVWADPKHREAVLHDQSLRAYMLRRAKQGIATLVRWDGTNAIAIFPPPLANDGQWHTIEGKGQPERTPRETFEGVATARAARKAG